ncbi:MAG: OsmC family protein [Bacteroidota bacterium]
MTSQVSYEGNLRTTAVHLKSDNRIITDAPTDNNGKGQAFSPTDLVATGLASCILTIMGIRATKMGINIDGAKAEVTKHMVSDPRRISKIDVVLSLPGADLVDKDKAILEKVGLTCPVAQSLHPDIEQHVSFTWT